MHGALKLLCQFLAVPSAPGHIIPQKRRMIKLIEPEHWMEIFGRVGDPDPLGEASKNTIIDLFRQVDLLWTAWQKFVKRSQPIKAPLVDGAALLLEFYDTELFVNWFATGNTRCFLDMAFQSDLLSDWVICLLRSSGLCCQVATLQRGARAVDWFQSVC